jgi:hypothetical protein
VNIKEQTANEGRRTMERIGGAPRIADARTAAAHNIALPTQYFLVILIPSIVETSGPGGRCKRRNRTAAATT